MRFLCNQYIYSRDRLFCKQTTVNNITSTKSSKQAISTPQSRTAWCKFEALLAARRTTRDKTRINITFFCDPLETNDFSATSNMFFTIRFLILAIRGKNRLILRFFFVFAATKECSCIIASYLAHICLRDEPPSNIYIGSRADPERDISVVDAMISARGRCRESWTRTPREAQEVRGCRYWTFITVWNIII